MTAAAEDLEAVVPATDGETAVIDEIVPDTSFREAIRLSCAAYSSALCRVNRFDQQTV